MPGKCGIKKSSDFNFLKKIVNCCQNTEINPSYNKKTKITFPNDIHLTT